MSLPTARIDEQGSAGQACSPGHSQSGRPGSRSARHNVGRPTNAQQTRIVRNAILIPSYDRPHPTGSQGPCSRFAIKPPERNVPTLSTAAAQRGARRCRQGLLRNDGGASRPSNPSRKRRMMPLVFRPLRAFVRNPQPRSVARGWGSGAYGAGNPRSVSGVGRVLPMPLS